MTDINTPTGDPEFDVQDQDELKEIHEFDFERAVMLMSIAEKVATVSPKNTALLGIAQAELEFMNEQAKDIARRRADRAKEAEQRRYEAEQERIRQENAETEPQNNGARVDRGGSINAGPRAIPSDRLQSPPAPPPEGGEPSPARRL